MVHATRSPASPAKATRSAPLSSSSSTVSSYQGSASSSSSDVSLPPYKNHPDFDGPNWDVVVRSSDNWRFLCRSAHLIAGSAKLKEACDQPRGVDSSAIQMDYDVDTVALFLHALHNSGPSEYTDHELMMLLTLADAYDAPSVRHRTLSFMLASSDEPYSPPVVFGLAAERQEMVLARQALGMFGSRILPDPPSTKRGVSRQTEAIPAKWTVMDVPEQCRLGLPRKFMETLHQQQIIILNYGGDWKEWAEAAAQKSFWAEVKLPETSRAVSKVDSSWLTPKKGSSPCKSRRAGEGR